MQISRERKIEEAVRRMKTLGVIDDAISQFQKDGIVMVSEPPFGALYTIDEEQKKLVEEFENEHNAVVYMVVKCYSTIGKMDSFLYVSDYEDEWEMEAVWFVVEDEETETNNPDMSDGYIMSYTHNYDAPECSEFGEIRVRQSFGGLLRTA